MSLPDFDNPCRCISTSLLGRDLPPTRPHSVYYGERICVKCNRVVCE